MTPTSDQDPYDWSYWVQWPEREREGDDETGPLLDGQVQAERSDVPCFATYSDFDSGDAAAYNAIDARTKYGNPQPLDAFVAGNIALDAARVPALRGDGVPYAIPPGPWRVATVRAVGSRSLEVVAVRAVPECLRKMPAEVTVARFSRLRRW